VKGGFVTGDQEVVRTEKNVERNRAENKLFVVIYINLENTCPVLIFIQFATVSFTGNLLTYEK
jgi:hypothetical protein